MSYDKDLKVGLNSAADHELQELNRQVASLQDQILDLLYPDEGEGVEEDHASVVELKKQISTLMEKVQKLQNQTRS